MFLRNLTKYKLSVLQGKTATKYTQLPKLYRGPLALLITKVDLQDFAQLPNNLFFESFILASSWCLAFRLITV